SEDLTVHGGAQFTVGESLLRLSNGRLSGNDRTLRGIELRFRRVVVALRQRVRFVESNGAREILFGLELAGLGLLELTFVLIDRMLIVVLTDRGDDGVFLHVVALLEIPRLTVGTGSLHDICDVATGLERERQLRVGDDAGGIAEAFAS